MKTLLIMNPVSGSGGGKRLWPRWQSLLAARGVDFDSAVTLRPGHGVELAAGSRDYDAVVAVGGDGTINEVLDGVIQSGRADLRMGVLYSGTSPDFCAFHRIPTRPSRAVEALVAGRSRRVDVARIAYAGTSGKRTMAHFACGSNVGLGPSIARVSNRIRRFMGDLPGTALAAVWAILTTRPADLDVTIDAAPKRLANVINLSILKNPFLASGLRLNLDLRPDDGTLALFAVQGNHRISALSALPGFYSGRAAARRDVFAGKCSRVSVACSENREVEFDGDPRGFLPVEIEILPGALDLIGADHERA